MEATKINLKDITVCTDYYEYEYSRTPKGRGTWAFSIGDLQGYRNVEKVFWTKSMTYREAVKVAKKEAQRRGVDVVYVLP